MKSRLWQHKKRTIMIKKVLLIFISKYRHTTLSRWAVHFGDLAMLAFVFALAEMFRYHGVADIPWGCILVKYVTFAIVCTLLYIGVGTHRSIIRHSGLYDIYKSLISNAVIAVLLIVFNVVNNRAGIVANSYTASYSEIIMTFSMQIVFMICMRMTLRHLYWEYLSEKRPANRVVIYGAGAAGVLAKNALGQSRDTEYKIVAFVDDDKKKRDTALDGIHVMSQDRVLNERFVKENKVETLIIAMPTASFRYRQSITTRGLDLGLAVKTVPHISTWIDGQSFQANQIQDIKIEDLLARDSIVIDKTNITREVAGKVVMVTGAAGSIGSEICRQLIRLNPSRIVMLDQAESPMYDLQFELKNTEEFKPMVERMVFVIGNVKDRQRMDEVFRIYAPQIIYHAAAYKHVPFMEENPYESIYVNVFGTKNIADLAIRYGAQKFVMVSTDKAVNPTNVMGATKRMAEIYIQSRSTDKTHFVTTRFGNVLGSNGSVIPLFKKQLAAGGPLTITHRDIIRYFMTIPEACNLVLEAGAMGKGGDIFVFDMGKPVKIYDLARRMIQLSGLSGIQIKEIGLRPGEKLYEELLATKENNIETHHPKIMRAQVRRYEVEAIDKAYAELWDLMPTLDDMKLVGKMKSIVPEFKSNNSVFCTLDKENE